MIDRRPALRRERHVDSADQHQPEIGLRRYATQPSAIAVIDGRYDVDHCLYANTHLEITEKQASGPALQPATEPGPSSASSAPPLVHVVNDDGSFRAAVGRMLRMSNFDVALYESADQLLAKPLSGDRGCILLDVRMMGLDGLELQDRLVRLGNVLPIIFLTGHGDIPTSVRAIKAGADDFLSKPVSTATLREPIRRALERFDRPASSVNSWMPCVR